MSDETEHESEQKHEDRCKDKEHGHKHYHERHWEWRGGAPLWCIGWLVTIGYLRMPFFWKGVLALVIWQYYLGRAIVH